MILEKRRKEDETKTIAPIHCNPIISLACVEPSIKNGDKTAITRLIIKEHLKHLKEDSFKNRSESFVEPNLLSILSMHPITKG
jgi:lipoprotein